MISSISLRRRISRSLATILALTLLQTVAPSVTNMGMPTATAAELFANKNNFQQWTTWQGVTANHTPYKTSAGTEEITSNADTINLTQDVGGQTGFLWNTQVFSYTQDLTVSANYYFGAKDGADGIMFAMRPLDQWPNDGIAGSSTGGWTHWAPGELRVIFDTYKNGIEMDDDHLRVVAATNAGAITDYNPTGTALKNGSGTTISNVEDNNAYPFTVKWSAASRTIAVYAGLAANHLIYSTTVSAAALDATQFSWGWMGWTGGASNYQSVANVTYHVGPTVSTTAVDTTVTDGTSVTFSASYTSSESAPTTRWEYSTDGGSTWTSTGTTSTTYTFTATRALTQRKYRFFISSTAVGATYTNATTPVTLTVNPSILGGETDTALAIIGSQYGWAADTGAGGVLDIRGAITLEAWIYPTETTTGTQYSVVTKSEAYQLFHFDGIWKYALWGGGASWGSGIPTGIQVELNEWHHVAFTRAAATNEVNFYYDGVLAYKGLASGATTGQIADSSFPFAVGGMVYNGPTLQYPFKGRVDNVALFDTVRDAASIVSDMHSYISPSTAGLRAYFDMNEGTGSTLFNRASTAVAATDLTIVGTPAFPDIKEASISGSYNVIKFPRSYITSLGGWKVPVGVSSAAALIVGGGGGGGSRVGGGGGAGALLYQSSVSLTVGSVESIIIGQGGFGGKTGNIAANNYQGVTGQNTVFGSRYTLLGGGGGGGYNTADNTGHEGKSGGSGGGATANFAAGAWPAGTGAGATTQFSTYGYGNGFSGGSGFNGTGYPGGGGGGSAGAAANLTSTSVAGNGGAATLDPILGTTTCYAGGGGGGVGELFSGSAGAGGACTGGTTTAGSGTKDNLSNGGSAAANSGSGGGGSGYQSGSNNSTDKAGGNGGSGIIIMKFVLATTKPIFVGPKSDTTTAGLTETFTVTGEANAPMVRSYLWQISTDTGTTWSTPTQGSGWFTNSYVTPVLTTSMSGVRYQYRVVVTDTDTAGVRLVDTSTAVYLIINPALTLTGSTTIYKAINVAKVETFTVTGGTAGHRYSLSPTISGINLDTSTALSPVIRISETKTVGTYYETLTVTDSVSVTVSLLLTIQVISPPSFSASSELVDSGTVLHLDAASTASYPLSGNTWNDLSGRKLAATLNYNTGTSAVNANGTTRAGTNWLSSVQCTAPTFSNDAIGAMGFNGSSTCSYISNFGYLPRYTYEVWLKRDGDQTISSTIVTTPYRFTSDQINISLIWNGATALVAGIFNGNTTNGWSSTPMITIPNQTWVHAAVTYNGSTLSLIINGETTTTASVSVTWNPAIIDGGLLLGRKWDNSQTFRGALASLRIYDRVLTLGEIQQNYNASKARFSSTVNKVAPSKKYGTRVVDTYTVTSGAGVVTATLASNNQSAIKWDTSTARSIKLTAQESLTVGSYLETITVTDSLGQSTYLPLRYSVTQADTLTITMDTSTVVTFSGSQITVYPKPVFKGLVGVDTLTVTTKFSSSTYTLSATRPTNADTYTVIAADPVFGVGAASNYLAVVYETSTAVVNKARQAALNPSLYGAYIGSPFYLSLLGGSGDGSVTETLTGTSTAPNCAISNHTLSSTTNSTAYCTVTFTKAASQNYLLETITVQVYFMSYVINQPSGQIGGGSTIGLNGETSITRDSNAAPTIASVSYTPASCANNVCTAEYWTITGAGFGSANNLDTLVKFWRNKVATMGQATGGNRIVSDNSIEIWSIPAGATTGKITVTTANGMAVSIDNWIAP